MCKIFFLTLFLAVCGISSKEFMQADILPYGGGSTEITSQINEYQNIVANKPIQGILFVTHDNNNPIDINSFRLGDKPLKVTFVQTTRMSLSSNLVVTIYNFQLDGLPIGTYTLPPINVKVAGKEVQALPLVIEVSNY